MIGSKIHATFPTNQVLKQKQQRFCHTPFPRLAGAGHVYLFRVLIGSLHCHVHCDWSQWFSGILWYFSFRHSTENRSDLKLTTTVWDQWAFRLDFYKCLAFPQPLCHFILLIFFLIYLALWNKIETKNKAFAHVNKLKVSDETT